jgi:spore maturation protein CgeB
MRDPLKKYRKRFRVWNNDRRLHHECRSYDHVFASRHLILPDDQAIRQAIMKKFPLLKPGKKRALNIMAIYHHYNWENAAFKPALEKFGCVRQYDWFDPFNSQGQEWQPSLKPAMNRHLIESVERWIQEGPADVIFAYLSGEQVTPQTLREIQAFGIPMINLALNDKESFVGKIREGQAMGSRDICRWFTLCWTSTEDALKKYCVEGALPVYLPEAANPDIHKPCNIEKSMDVSFIGQCYGNRAEIINRLLACGIGVEAYGYGWPRGPLTTEEMVRLYSRSRINLGFGGVIGHTDTYCLKGRDFEIPMSGGLYLTEYHPELERVYKIGEEIVAYTGFDDLLEKIRSLLSHPDRAAKIRQKGFERACREHTWEMRFEKIFSLIGLI